MNRQLKRANEKSDKRREREQEKRKTQRRESRVRVTQTKRESSSKKPSSKERSAPGMGRSRLAGAYLILVIGIILSQALVPQRTDTFSLVVQSLFYLILSYFLVLWFYRRGVERAAIITLAGALGLALAVEGLKFLLPQLGFPQIPAPEGSTSAPNLLFVALAVPGILLGTWLGRYIYKRS